MLSIARQIYSLLTPAERKQSLLCFFAMLVMGLLEVLGVASIMPFMAVVSDPSVIEHNAKIAWVYHYLQFTSPNRFMIFLGFFVLGLLLLGNALTVFTLWFILKFTCLREYELSKRLLTIYLQQPYEFFLNRNPSELSKNILTEVSRVIKQAFIPGMQLIAKGIIAILILGLLFVVNPILAGIALVILGGAYAGIYFIVRGKLNQIGARGIEESRVRFTLVNEVFGGIKEVKLLGKEKEYLKLFTTHTLEYAKDTMAGLVITQIPRYALETIAFSGVLLIVVYLLFMQHDITNAIPILALYAFATLRLMPALQQIFTSVSYLRISKHAIDILCLDLLGLTVREYDDPSEERVCIQKSIEFRDVTFNYSNTVPAIVKQLSFKIPAKTKVGFVGLTGAGKTTIIDMLLGLLQPQQGKILIDDHVLTSDNLLGWQKNIGYVPQNIYLSDASIAQNIAFGVPKDKIDMEAVKYAVKIANLETFITSLDSGYDTVVGDRGIRLSGGQRQRIGIARALYHDPEILVLDEATSSLDTLTEEGILDAITHLLQQKTIIMVAHRLTTLVDCDLIYFLQDGKIISSGKYEELLKINPQFQAMAKATPT